MSRILIASLVLLTPLTGCSVRSHYHLPTEEEELELQSLVSPGLEADPNAVPTNLPPGPFATSIKAEYGKHFLPVEINGQPADLLLDWGSWTTVAVMPHMVRLAKLVLSDTRMQTSTYDGAGEMRKGTIQSMKVGEVTLEDLPFVMTPKDLTIILSGFVPVYRAKGLFGLLPLVGYGRFAVDLKVNKIYFGSLPETLMQHSDRITLSFRKGLGLYIDVTLDGMPCQMKIDIGGWPQGWAGLEGPIAAQTMQRYHHVFAGRITGVGNHYIKTYATRMAEIRAGDYLLKNTIVHLTPSDESSETPESDSGPFPFCGTVGNRFFGDTLVGVDWHKSELYFIPVQGVLNQEPDSFALLHWLVGTWGHRSKDGTISQEHWNPPGQGATGREMTGWNKSSRWDQPDSPEQVEQLVIRETPAGLVYIADPPGQEKTTFKLVENQIRRVVFENPDHDFPQRVIYWRELDKLHARIEGTVDGQTKSAEWEWKRVEEKKPAE